MLLWLRGKGELPAIEAELKSHVSAKDTLNASKDTSVWTELRKPSVLKPFLLLNAIFLLMIGSGANVVVFYAVSMFQVLAQKIGSYGSEGYMRADTYLSSCEVEMPQKA